ncbi:MAG: site-2 protease family protein [Planctomycetota bacterium]
MFGQIRPTPFDLNFETFGIPVRVHPLFWALPLIIAFPMVDSYGPMVLVVSVLVVFLSLLTHELGHALLQRVFGFRPHIVLYMMGGYAAPEGRGSMLWWHQVLIIAAGPAAQLALFGVMSLLAVGLAVTDRYPAAGSPAEAAMTLTLLINLIWPLINLVPVYPLDGGQIVRWVLIRLRPWDGVRLSLIVSIVSGVGFGAWMMTTGLSFFGFLLLFCAYQSFQELQGPRMRF